MPRPIHVPQDSNSLATYTLSAREEWTLLAVTFNLIALSGAGSDGFAWIDYRDPAGGIIYLQPLEPGDGASMFYSLSPDASEWSAEPTNPPFTPQLTDQSGYFYVSQRLSPHTLYAGCTVNVYKTAGVVQPPTDPLTALSADYQIPDLHLWVEDAGRVDYVPPPPLPPILVHAPATADETAGVLV